MDTDRRKQHPYYNEAQRALAILPRLSGLLKAHTCDERVTLCVPHAWPDMGDVEFTWVPHGFSAAPRSSKPAIDFFLFRVRSAPHTEWSEWEVLNNPNRMRFLAIFLANFERLHDLAIKRRDDVAKELEDANGQIAATLARLAAPPPALLDDPESV